jgi:tripartite-type tricarboxylate transporter receptor subunit TctC
VKSLNKTMGATHRCRLLAAVGLATALLANVACAQAPWPTQSIKLVVPYPAGGNADAVARLIASKLAVGLAQSVVIENRAGAGGTIGTDRVAKSNGDGYTFLMTPSAVVAITPHLRKVPYDPASELLPVAMVSSSYGLVAARKDLPVNNMTELVALAKREPGKLTFGSAGAATATHITGEIVNLKAGIKLLHVPYKGSVEALSDLLAGRIDVIYDPVALAQVKAGNLKVLAVTSSTRHPDLPGVPTLREQKLDVPLGSWFGVFAPRGTPASVISRLAAEIEKVVSASETSDQMARFSQYPDYRGTEAFSNAIREDSAFFKAFVAQSGIKAE